jgi:hypothetical protein
MGERALALSGRARTWGRSSPATGVPRDIASFHAGDGPLGRIAVDLDDAFYGEAQRNRRDLLLWSVATLFAGLRQLGLMRYGVATPTPAQDELQLARSRPKPRDLTAWIREFHLVEEDTAPDQGWEFSSAWRLDVLLALAELPRSQQRLFRHYADGLGWDEAVGRKDLRELGDTFGHPWQEDSVRSGLKAISQHVRRRTELDAPARQERRGPRPEATQTSSICQVEREWGRCRRSRRPRAGAPA